ncbi:alkaline phosphatase family protein [Nocardioides sp.]|uniref:alkaline phosphatase family protein n=1 Tax=Nocardioides sp. TaxID=35761 RepID=UPI00356A1228
MCEPTNHEPGKAFAEGMAAVRTGRRTLLQAGAAGMLFSTAVAAPAEAARRAAPRVRPDTKRRAYVLVVDGCRPDEITASVTPHLFALREGGLHHPRASAMPVMETIPNHVMMMTGVRPDRTGVPANSIYDRAEGKGRTMDRPEDIKAVTVIEQLNQRGFTTGTVLSKDYLYGVFGERPTHRWEPAPIIPVSGHAPDLFTMNATLSMIEEFDPHLVFVNLGDIDRMGHSDFTGTNVRLARQVALADTDALVGRFVDMLKSSGRWEDSIVIVVADHSMDWSDPDRLVSLQPVLQADPLLAGNIQIEDNGGADLVYWTGPDSQRNQAIKRIRQLARGVDGVLVAHRRDKPWLRLGPEAGDVVVFCKAGWRFSDPNQLSNPIPGNHGHPATRRIPFFIGGGHPNVPQGKNSSAGAHTVDVAPTVAAFFGIRRTPGGWDGRNRLRPGRALI